MHHKAPLKLGLNVGAAVLSGDFSSSAETATRRSESGSHIFIRCGVATRHEKLR